MGKKALRLEIKDGNCLSKLIVFIALKEYMYGIDHEIKVSDRSLTQQTFEMHAPDSMDF